MKKKDMSTTSNNIPKLYSKTAILIFSILLSTFFGSLLFAENLKETEKKKDIFKVILFSIIWNALLMNLNKRIIINGFLLYGVVNVLGGLILIFPFWNFYLKDFVEFQRRKVWGPIIIFIVVLGGFAAFLLFKHN